jgi:hypothetical protein
LVVGGGGEEVFDGILNKRSQNVRRKRREGVVVGQQGRKDDIFVFGRMSVELHWVLPFH